jgi:hypothetical protein
MWEDTITVAINPEFSKTLIEKFKEKIEPDLKRVEGKGDQYFVDTFALYCELYCDFLSPQDTMVLKELRNSKINFIQI